MKVSVWDTYVKRQDGSIMHFDILVPSNLKDEAIVFGFGLNYLHTKAFKTLELSSNECRFCHIEQATKDIIATIRGDEYAIIEMENCN